ncbi:MAG: hypothetical protein M3Q29_22615 [Chloroflexota bacterium]|nr:hypothetical protein [Chloroflexota bacterium]
MRTITSTMAALMLALLLAAPVLAGGEEDDTVTKTFELTLYGDVPEEATFSVFYLSLNMPVDRALEEISQHPEKYFPGQQRVIQFCGPRLDVGLPTERVSDEACRGGGTIYAHDVELPRGGALYFAYERAPADTPEGHEAFFGSDDGDGRPETEDLEALDGDRTNAAWFRYGAAADDQQDMPDMPDTGAGGLAGASLPPALASAAGCSVLAVGGYALGRLRRIRRPRTPNSV